MPRRPEKLIIWYDGSCRLCTREIAVMRSLDKRKAIMFVDATAEDLACPIDRSVLVSRFHASEDGKILSGAAAFAAMWRAIPGLRLFGLVGKNRIVLAVLEFLYLQFLKVRPFVQRAVR